ncbi:MAG: hypothetical protein ACRENB_11480, partial [Gemmatimonadales bacterium]
MSLSFSRRVYVFVVSVAVAAGLALAVSSGVSTPFPGAWGLFSLSLAGFLVETSRTKLRSGDASGSLIFMVAIASITLFGPFWGAIVVAISTFFGQVLRRLPGIKIAFNVSQHVLSALVAWGTYSLLGGEVLAPILLDLRSMQFGQALILLGAYLGGALTYFLTNSLAVSTVVAL